MTPTPRKEAKRLAKSKDIPNQEYEERMEMKCKFTSACMVISLYNILLVSSRRGRRVEDGMYRETPRDETLA